MAFVKGFHKLSDVLDTICSYIIVVMLGAMVVITGAQIVCRMAFTALSWSEEATRYLLVWSSFLGASCVYKHSGHISITFVQDMVPAALSKVLKRPCGLHSSFCCRDHLWYEILRKTGKPAVCSDASSHEIYLPLHSGRMRIHARTRG